MIDADATYKRGQVEWAVWRTLKSRVMAGTNDPPPMFKTRIKRLLELDRKRADAPEFAGLAQRYAFFDAKPEGQGVEVQYRPFNAFCLTLGLELLDSGHKQSDVVFILKHSRKQLEPVFNGICRRSPKPGRSAHLAKDYPDLTHYELKGALVADWRVFMVVRKFEMHELIATPVRKKLAKDAPMVLEPALLDGRSALDAWLDKHVVNLRSVWITEIAWPAHYVVAFLDQAPEVRRGRP